MFLSVIGLARRTGRIEAGLAGVERSVEWLQADTDGLREDAKAISFRLPANVEKVADSPTSLS